MNKIKLIATLIISAGILALMAGMFFLYSCEDETPIPFSDCSYCNELLIDRKLVLEEPLPNLPCYIFESVRFNSNGSIDIWRSGFTKNRSFTWKDSLLDQNSSWKFQRCGSEFGHCIIEVDVGNYSVTKIRDNCDNLPYTDYGYLILAKTLNDGSYLTVAQRNDKVNINGKIYYYD